MPFPVLDADGHVTETTEQVAKYLDEPYRRRPLTFPFYPWDGWDRRLLGALGDFAGTAEAWLRALDRGGVEQAVLYPTLGLFMSFLKDREWAVALCRAYNSLLHEEFVRVSPRLQAVALLPVQDPEAAARELRRGVRDLGLVGGMLAADGSHLLGDARFLPVYEEADRLEVMLAVHASGSHLGGAGVDLFPRFIQAHTVSHPFGQMRQLTSIIFEGIPERFGRRVRQARGGGAGAAQAPQRVRPERDDFLLVRGRRVAASPGAAARRREPDRLRLRFPPLGPQLPGLHRGDQEPG